MKKILVAIAMTTACSFGDIVPLDIKTCTEAEVRSVVQQIIAEPNVGKREKALRDSRIYYLRSRNDFDALRHEIDVAFADAKVDLAYYVAASFPLSTSNSLERTASRFPIRVGLVKKYAAMGHDKCPNSFYNAQDLVALLNEVVNSPDYSPEPILKFLNAKVSTIVKHYLRSQGKSFVVKNGVNPCEQYLNAFNTAINAPRFSGLSEWLSQMGITPTLDMSKFPSAEDINSLKTDILNGDKEINTINKHILYIGLGPEAYNAFVREYNGD